MSQSRPSSASPSNHDDFALVAGVRERDAAAMTALYDHYSSMVYGVCLRALRDVGNAERRGAVVQAMQTLPTEQRAAAELTFFQAMSHAEEAGYWNGSIRHPLIEKNRQKFPPA